MPKLELRRGAFAPPPAQNEDANARLHRLEMELIRLHAKMDYLIQQEQAQAEFRTWAIRIGLSAVALVVLNSLGLEISQ